MTDATRTLTVEFKGDTSHLSRAARRAADDVEDAGQSISRSGKLFTAGLSPFLDNDIAEKVGAALGKIPVPALAAGLALAEMVAALAGVAAMGLAAGAALAVVGTWLYGQRPDSVFAHTVNDVRDELDQLGKVVSSVVGPVFDELATAWGPIVIGMLQDLQRWVLSNKDQIRDWILVLARAFTQGTIVATYFGQVLLWVSASCVLILVNSLGACAYALGGLIGALGVLTGNEGLKGAGRDFQSAGKNAMQMSDDIVAATMAGNQGLIQLREGAKAADKALDDIEGTRHATVIVDYRTTQNRFFGGGGTPIANSAAAPPALMSAPVAAPVVNVTVNSLMADTAMVRQLEPTFRQVLAEIQRRN